MTEHEPDHTIFERRDPLVGNTLDGRFRIDARLAAGGFGAIYRATELRSGREVALKVLHASLTQDPLIVARFRREGATLASLRDPHTVTAYELGEAADGTLYIVMELLRGETLYEVFRNHGGPLPWRRVAAIARAVCSSLAEAHALGIVHRDLKPANIHLQKRSSGEPAGKDEGVELDRDGQRDFVKVLDFGIAKILRGSDLDPSELTLAGQMIGTFDYMAPEQMLGGAVGPACDIYTLGVVMYEMITGQQPFAEATSPTHLLAMLLTTTPPPMSSRTPVPPALDEIVMRCLAREQQDRYPVVAELAAALDRVLAGGAPEEATLTQAASPIGHEDLTLVATRGAEPRVAGAPTHLTPARGARLCAAIAPAQPIEAIDVRAQGSQPVIAPARDDGRGSQPPMRGDGRGSQPPMAAPDDTYDRTVPARPHAAKGRGSQPVMAPYQPPPGAYPHGVDPRMAPYPVADAAARAPHAPMPAYADRRSQPVLDPRAAYPMVDGRGSQLAMQAAGWPQPQPARHLAGPGFDAARDAAVRNIVWALVIVLGFVLALVVAKLL